MITSKHDLDAHGSRADRTKRRQFSTDYKGQDRRGIRRGPTGEADLERFAAFSRDGGAEYPAIVRLRENAWAEMVPFLVFGGRLTTTRR